jgi:hypothetical protein
MSITNPSKPVARQTRAWTFGPQVLFWIAVAAAFTILAGAVTALSSTLVAPVASTLLLVMAAAAALVGWLRDGRAEADRLTYWDVAGALTFVGIGAAALIDSEQLARIFDAPPNEK